MGSGALEEGPTKNKNVVGIAKIRGGYDNKEAPEYSSSRNVTIYIICIHAYISVSVPVVPYIAVISAGPCAHDPPRVVVHYPPRIVGALSTRHCGARSIP